MNTNRSLFRTTIDALSKEHRSQWVRGGVTVIYDPRQDIFENARRYY